MRFLQGPLQRQLTSLDLWQWSEYGYLNGDMSIVVILMVMYGLSTGILTGRSAMVIGS